MRTNSIKMKKIFLITAFITLATSTFSQSADLKLWYNSPANYFEESLPIGNGKLGASIYGGADFDTIFLNDIHFGAESRQIISKDLMHINTYQTSERRFSMKTTSKPTRCSTSYRDTTQHSTNRLQL